MFRVVRTEQLVCMEVKVSIRRGTIHGGFGKLSVKVGIRPNSIQAWLRQPHYNGSFQVLWDIIGTDTFHLVWKSVRIGRAQYDLEKRLNGQFTVV